MRDRIVRDLARGAARDAAAISDGLDAELFASSLVGTWQIGKTPLSDLDPDEVFGRPAAVALERVGSAGALAALRALAVVGPAVVARESAAAAERLAGRGVADPAWIAALGRARPLRAQSMRDRLFDDGLSVLLEFDQPGVERHTLGVYIDHNIGGIAKDAFLGGALDEVAALLAGSGEQGIALEEVSLGEAGARISAALEATDITLDAPASDDLRALRAFIDTRLGMLPAYEEITERPEVPASERGALLADFLASAEGERFAGDEDARDIVTLVIDFAADYMDGRPLRWSPAVVEIFMTAWLPRKVLREPGFFARVADVLPAWVRYAGRCWGAPADAVEEVAASVSDWEEELLDAVNDPAAWGPAKTFAAAMAEAGIDPTDEAEVERFVAAYNASL